MDAKEDVLENVQLDVKADATIPAKISVGKNVKRIVLFDVQKDV